MTGYKTMITLEQQELCIKLYRDGQHTIKQILTETGIRSEQTVYRILDQAGIPRRPTRVSVMKVSVNLDKGAVDVIEMVKPKNLSEFVSEAIKAFV